MSGPKVFISRIIAKEALDKIAAATEMEVWQEELPPPYEVLLEKAGDAEGLVTLLTDRIDAAAIDRLPRLKVISNMAVGYDNIDIAAATARNIVVGYTPGVLTETPPTWLLRCWWPPQGVSSRQMIIPGRGNGRPGAPW